MADLNKVSSAPLRILIVDDHTIVRDGLRQILGGSFAGAFFADARNGQEALAQISKSKCDVVLLDITMPGQSGLDILKQIKLLHPEMKILVLTMHPEDQYAMRVLKAGASGYLTKETASDEVVNALKKVLAGGTYVSAAFSQPFGRTGQSGSKSWARDAFRSRVPGPAHDCLGKNC